MPAENVTGPFPVTKVVDGDTIWVDNKGDREKVRLVGMDTPELHDPRKPVECFAQEASDRAEAILDGQVVYLESDPSQDSVDRFGRTLAYVWTDSGRLFNYDMIYDGFAFEYTYDLPYRYQAQFRAAEADARTNERGLWAPTACE
jgi:micrococcal nuclease